MKKLFLIIAMLLFVAVASSTGPPGDGQTNYDVTIEMLGDNAVTVADACILEMPDGIVTDALLFRISIPMCTILQSEAIYQDDAGTKMKYKYRHNLITSYYYNQYLSRIAEINHNVTYRGFASSL